MFKKSLLLFTSLLIIYSCKKEPKSISKKDGFIISLSIEGVNNKKVFLHKFSSISSEVIDSTTVKNDRVEFIGVVTYPERYLITIEHVFGGKLIIIENDSIFISASKENLVNAQIIGSELNNELDDFLNKIEKIYSKVDALFPAMQRARLANDASKLKDISNKIQQIELEGIAYSFNYASENSNSFIAAMILNDLSKRDSIDIKKLESGYNTLSAEVKKSVDSKELIAFLNGSYK